MRQNWQLWEGVLSPQECDELVNLCTKVCTLQDGTVFNSADYSPNKNIRDTKIGWVEHPKVKSLMENYMHQANKNAFNVDASLIPAVQYGEYSEGNFYTWHHDVNWEGESMYDRKISLVVQLSDSSSYEGGDFQFKHIETPTAFRTQGSILAFLSYNEHQVTKVIKGTRRSLVTWAEGPRWR
jgi:PKHD-type hydroxylase